MPRILAAYLLQPSRRHGIGVFATRTLDPGVALGRVYLRGMGPLARLATLPLTAVLRGETLLAVTGGFPLWYVNYGAPSNIEIDRDGYVRTAALVLDGDELLLPPLPGGNG